MAPPGLLNIPQEVLDSILHFTRRADLKNLALASSTALSLVSSTLFRRVYISPKREILYYRDGNTFFDSEEIEKVLDATPRGLSYVRELCVASLMSLRHPMSPPHSGSECLTKADDFLLRLVLKKLSKDAVNLDTIRIPEDVSIKTLHLILSSFPNLRHLKVGEIGTMNSSEATETTELEQSQDPLNLETLHIGGFEESLVPAFLQILRRCGKTLREFSIGNDAYDIMPLRFGNWGVRFSPGSPEIDERKSKDPKISLPTLERLQIMNDGRFPGFLDLLGHLTSDCERLVRVRLDESQIGRSFLLNLIDRGASLSSLQIHGSTWEAGSLNTLLSKIRSLHTFKLSPHAAIYISDILPILEHRHTLKRLWLECPFSCFRPTASRYANGPHIDRRTRYPISPGPREISDCILGPTFFDPVLSKYPFSSEGWPLLEELAIPILPLDKMPLIHNLKVLCMLSQSRLGFGAGKSQERFVGRYFQLLWKYSNSKYNEDPKLKIIVVNDGVRSRSRLPEYTYYVPSTNPVQVLAYGVPAVKMYTRLSEVLKVVPWFKMLENDKASGFWDDRRQSDDSDVTESETDLEWGQTVSDAFQPYGVPVIPPPIPINTDFPPMDPDLDFDDNISVASGSPEYR